MPRRVERIASFIRVGGNAIAVHRRRSGNTVTGKYTPIADARTHWRSWITEFASLIRITSAPQKNEIPQRAGIPRRRYRSADPNAPLRGFTWNRRDPRTVAVRKAVRDRTRVYDVTPARTYSLLAGARYRASRGPVSCSRRTQYPMSQSIRETTMNVFEPMSMYRRKSSPVRTRPPVCGYLKKFVAACCAPPATAVPRRRGRPAKITGLIDSKRIAPLDQ